MSYDLTHILISDKVVLDQDFAIDLNVYHNDAIIDLKNLHVKGNIFYNQSDNLELDLVVSGVMVLNDSVTLDKIDYDFKSIIQDEYDTNTKDFKEYYEKEQNILDIMRILWENIVLEVPISKTVTEDVSLSGDGWSFGKTNINDNIDPRFAKLAELLDERKE